MRLQSGAWGDLSNVKSCGISYTLGFFVSSLGSVLHNTPSQLLVGVGESKAEKHLRRRPLMPTAPGAHFFNQPHHKNQKERNHNEQRERKKQQPCSPQPLLSSLPPQGGGPHPGPRLGPRQIC